MNELDLIFADWSEAVTLVVKQRDVDPADGAVTETRTETATQAILGGPERSPNDAAGGQHDIADLSVLVRTADIPEGYRPPSAYVAAHESEYRVTEVVRSADDATVLLRCRSMSFGS
ncbi:hypothetical protein [Stratiformator vulcanicus]|uniref:Phage head-tail joining protein n=1 Tax=Stratiformator vulcanicus TaxID=2527980 RepID=A0A517QWR0_9PLAN|nr:hypothetical protein [Stratiformator vulcanicus]QDT36105.1 hypothetical protein Pan189_04600 [Stratiformator vulcanicus]